MAKCILFLLAFSVVIGSRASSVEAQWSAVAPNLIGTGPYDNAGAMTYADGVAWACLYDLYKSTDQGSTWQKVTTPSTSGNIFHGVAFYDRTHGAVCTDQGLFITNDGGQTWQTYFSGETFFQAAYSGSANAIVAGSQFVHFTSNGGASWNTQKLGNITKDFHSAAPGQVLAFVETSNHSTVAFTSDYGVTWTERNGTMDADAHSFEVSQCDANTIYGINEEGGNYSAVDNDKAEIFQSKDGGATFTSIASYGLAALSGCALVTSGAVYVPSRSSGILQSTDGGASWSLLPGPNCPIDSHDIIAINDTMLLAADVSGTIWRTTKGVRGTSGSAGGLQILPLSLVDTLFPCDPPNVVVYLSYTSCTPTTAILNSATLSGSSHFRLDSTLSYPRNIAALDSLVLSYNGNSANADTSYLKLNITAGGITRDTTILIFSPRIGNSLGRSYPDGDLRVQSGGSLTIPVSENLTPATNLSTHQIEGLTFSLNFDPTILSVPQGQLASRINAPQGWTLELAYESVPGELRIILQNSSGAVVQDSLYLGTVQFDAVPNASHGSLVRLDYLVINATDETFGFCLASEGDFVANVQITSAGVTASKVSPRTQLSVFPDPVQIGTTLHVSWEAARPRASTLDLLDILGKLIEQHRFAASPTGVFDLTIPEHSAAGTYYLRFSDGESVQTRKIVVAE